MSSAPRIHAVTVHHNSSHFAELMLRTLFFTNDLRDLDFQVMVRELLDAPASIFANQARIYGYYAHRVIEGRDGIPGLGDADDLPPWQVSCSGMEYRTRLSRRCSPVCGLIANTEPFRKVVEVIGRGRAMGFQVGMAKWYDTFSVMTHVIETHGLRFIVSAKRVNHFTMTGYQPEARGLKDRNCLAMLEELRAGRGMGLDLFRESNWNRI